MACKRFGSVPKRFREHREDCVRIGKARKEQIALAILYNQIACEHERMHQKADMPFGVNPHVSTRHYQYHIMMDLIAELMDWSVMRAFPNQKSALRVLFDEHWVMYGASKQAKPPLKPPEE